MSNKYVQNIHNLFWKALIFGYWIESYQYGRINNKTFPIIINHIKASAKIRLQSVFWNIKSLKCLKHQETRVSFSVLPLWFIEWIMHLCQAHDHPFQTLASLTYLSPSTRSTHFTSNPPPHDPNYLSSKRKGAINYDRHDMQSLE